MTFVPRSSGFMNRLITSAPMTSTRSAMPPAMSPFAVARP
jgi:hypothetical protein